jgi:site-specific DNA recombinase
MSAALGSQAATTTPNFFFPDERDYFAAPAANPAALEAELADVDRRIAQMLDAIEQGIVTATTKERLLALEAKRDQLTANFAKVAETASPPALHPNLAEIYRRKVTDLETALDDASIRGDAALALRGLIDAVVLHPGAKRGEVRAELCGELAALLQLGSAQTKTRTSEDVRVSLVAGTRNPLYRTHFHRRR